MITRLTSMFAAACLCLWGCKQETTPAPKQPADSSSSGNPLTAPADYVGAVGKAQQSAKRVVGAVGLDQAIKAFAAEEGRYPTDLNELVTKGTISSIPPVPAGMRYEYDPKTGIVKVVPQ